MLHIVIELQTSEVVFTAINATGNIKKEKVNSYVAYNDIEVQTSEKPKFESSVGYIAEIRIKNEPFGGIER